MLGVSLAVVACQGPEERGPPLVPADVAASGVQACPHADERAAVGPFERRAVAVERPSDPWIWAGGVVVADLNADGWPDAVAPVESGLAAYEGSALGLVVPTTVRFPDDVDLSFASGGSTADYDADGDLDLYVTRVAGSPAPEGGEYGRNRLLRNDGGVFVDVTDEAGVDGCGVHHRTGEPGCFRSMTSSWGDVDLDGDLDLYVGNYGFADETGTPQDEFLPGEPDFLYLNLGDGTFEDASAVIPPEVHDGYTYAGGLHDLDADGDLDLYVVNDFGNCYPNRVMWNEGGELVWRGQPSDDPCPGNAGADPSYLELSMTGMSLAVGDWNDDGWLDLAIPEWKGNSLLVSDALGHWVESADVRGFVNDFERGQDVGWGTEAGDLDNDGDLDLVAPFGYLESDNPRWENSQVQPDAVYLAEPDGAGGFRFVDHAPTLGMDDPGMERGTAIADVNRDGWLDVAKRNLVGPDVFYASRCGTEAWLLVDVRQPGTANTFGVGARVEVVAGGQRWLRHVVAGGTGFASSGPLEAHFGLGALDHVDVVRITWPDGRASDVRDLDTRQQVTITRR